MGPGEGASELDRKNAFELGKRIAERGWVVLSGGRNEGVMAQVNEGAKSAQGLTVGIIAGGDDRGICAAVDIPIITNMGSARNNINVLSSMVVIACGMGPGTASEIALALKAGKPVILLTESQTSKNFFQELGGNKVYLATSPEDAVEICASIMQA